ncbi:hypothetical protein MRX96_055140 [Rhipicephalus microplus]
MTAKTEKNAEGNLDGVADMEEVGDEMAPEDEEGCRKTLKGTWTLLRTWRRWAMRRLRRTKKGAENAKVQKTQVDVEEAVQSRDGEEENEKVKENVGEEDGAEKDTAENWEAATDGEVEYYKERDGMPQDAE